ncbi:class A sortase [Lactococcus garvieae]
MTAKELVAHQFKDKNLAGIGIISIPAINLELPVFNGVTYETMMYGAGTAKPNQVMGEGNYALASHTIFNSFTGAVIPNVLFGNLISAQIGQHIYLTDKAQKYDYQIDSIYKTTVNQGNIIDDHNKKKRLLFIPARVLQGISV